MEEEGWRSYPMIREANYYKNNTYGHYASTLGLTTDGVNNTFRSAQIRGGEIETLNWPSYSNAAPLVCRFKGSEEKLRGNSPLLI